MLTGLECNASIVQHCMHIGPYNSLADGAGFKLELESWGLSYTDSEDKVLLGVSFFVASISLSGTESSLQKEPLAVLRYVSSSMPSIAC